MSNTERPRVFYVKCRPQGADAWEIARDAKFVFVGYPLHRRDRNTSAWRKQSGSELFVDPCRTDWKEHSRETEPGYRRQVSANRNLAAKISEGSYVIVPRLGDGMCYVGQIASRFHIAEQPAWAEQYLSLRKKAGLKVDNELSHVGDVVQGWTVDGWEAVPFAGLPRWISYRLLSRNTAGVVNDLQEPKISAHEEVKRLVALPKGERYQPLRDATDLERALLDWCSPQSFEHLVVALLQLEAEPNRYWHHVGGSGDQGIDGICVDGAGRRVAVLQCKWRYNNPPQNIARKLRPLGTEVVVAVLSGRHQDAPEKWDWGVFLNRQRIAALVRKNCRRLPFATSVGLGRE